MTQRQEKPLPWFNLASLRPESIKKLIDLIHPISFGREGGCESPGLRICRLVDSRNHLLRKSKRPSGPDPQMNRKRGEGLSLKGGKEGWGFVLGGAALRSFRKERISESHSLPLSLEVGRDKVNMIFALVFPTKLSTFLSFSFGRLSPTLWLQWWEQPPHSGAPMNNSYPPYYI